VRVTSSLAWQLGSCYRQSGSTSCNGDTYLSLDNGGAVHIGVGAALTEEQYAGSQTWERAYTAEVTAWWANDFDLLLTPAAGAPPALLEELLPPPEDPLAILPRFERIWCFAAPFSVTGQPAISLPVGTTATGVPVGVQLVAALGREDLLLRVAAQIEQAAPWAARHPPL